MTDVHSMEALPGTLIRNYQRSDSALLYFDHRVIVRKEEHCDAPSTTAKMLCWSDQGNEGIDVAGCAVTRQHYPVSLSLCTSLCRLSVALSTRHSQVTTGRSCARGGATGLRWRWKQRSPQKAVSHVGDADMSRVQQPHNLSTI